MQQGVRVSEASEGDVKARPCSGGDVEERIRCGTAVLGGTKGKGDGTDRRSPRDHFGAVAITRLGLDRLTSCCVFGPDLSD